MLVLSREAGAAAELGVGALLVDTAWISPARRRHWRRAARQWISKSRPRPPSGRHAPGRMAVLLATTISRHAGPICAWHQLSAAGHARVTWALVVRKHRAEIAATQATFRRFPCPKRPPQGYLPAPALKNRTGGIWFLAARQVLRVKELWPPRLTSPSPAGKVSCCHDDGNAGAVVPAVNGHATLMRPKFTERVSVMASFFDTVFIALVGNGLRATG